MLYFVFEEELMEEVGYLFCVVYKCVYEIFGKCVVEYWLCFQVGEDIIDELCIMLLCWLFNYICGDDKVYVLQVKQYFNQFVCEYQQGSWLGCIFKCFFG